jgi:hypothetical protein
LHPRRLNTGRGHARTDRYGPGSGNRRDAWRSRPWPAPYRGTVSKALATAWALLARNGGRERYRRAWVGGRHRR